MGNLYNKTNAPYLIAGTLATLALLASGTLAVAPYVAFLSPIAAFNVALPVALSLSILSTLILALSCKMISRNKKLAAQGAELNEKTELAAEQENTIQSLEPQIKELNKRLSSQYNEIEKLIGSAATKEELNKLSNEVEKLIGSAATKGEVEELVTKIASAATKEELNKLSDEIKKLGTSAATKEGLNKKVSDLETKLDEISKQANGATTKGEMEELVTKIASAATKEELNKLSDEIKKLGTSAATKEGLNKKVSDLETKLDEISKQTNGAATKIGELKAGLNGAATKEELEERLGSLIKEVEVKEELQMKFYGKDEEREKITFDNVILPNNIKERLVKIYQPNALEKGEGKGYILHGPPGTGKTMIARAIASETKDKSAFISVSGSSLFNIQNINDLFKKAKENAPCIVFM